MDVKMRKLLCTILALCFFLIFTVACRSDINTPVSGPSVPDGAEPFVPGGLEPSGGPGSGMGGGGSGSFYGYMSYSGPVLPVSVLSNAGVISAVRDITFGFSRFSSTDPLYYRNYSSISDNYILTNDTEDDIVVEMAYPFIGNFLNYNSLLPVVTLNNSVLETKLAAGAYTGGFTGSMPGDGLALNLKQVSSWEGYAEVLADGGYLNRALGNAPGLNQLVTVYEFSNARADHSAAVAPTVAAKFTLDFARTRVLTYSFNGADWDNANGFMRQSFFVPREGFPRYDRSFYLIATGDDIGDLVIQGYQNGGCYAGEEIDVTVDVTRYEMELGDALARILSDFMETTYENLVSGAGYDVSGGSLDMAMPGKAVAESLLEFGMLSENAVARYSMGMSDFWYFFSDVFVMDRIFYLTFDVSIKAGDSVRLNVDMVKPGSFSFYADGTGEKGVFGYDMMVMPGDGLMYENVTANISDVGNIEIVRQDFGFDIADNNLSVSLNPDTPHYFLEVRWR